MTLTPVRYFDATQRTLDYIIEEHASDEEADVLREAMDILGRVEGDVFDYRECPECDFSCKGHDSRTANERLEQHRGAIHR